MHHPRDMATYPAGIDLTLERVFLRQALAGRDDAFVLLGSMYSEQVYAIARNLCSTDGEALELTRNAFQRAREELSWIPARQSFRTFVCRFLVSEAVKRLRFKAPPASASLERFLPGFADGKLVSPLTALRGDRWIGSPQGPARAHPRTTRRSPGRRSRSFPVADCRGASARRSRIDHGSTPTGGARARKSGLLAAEWILLGSRSDYSAAQ